MLLNTIVSRSIIFPDRYKPQSENTPVVTIKFKKKTNDHTKNMMKDGPYAGT